MTGDEVEEPATPVARPRRRTCRPLGALLVALLAVACGVDTSAPTARFDASSTPPAARPLVVVADLEPLRSLDPARAACEPCRMVVAATYETLLVPGAGGAGVAAGLARSWSSGDDLSTFTFEIDPGAAFAGGDPVEAGDVVWSWERVVAAGGPAASLLEGLADIEAAGPRTVVARFRGPNADLPVIVTDPALAVVDRDAVETGGLDLDVAVAGSGPYLLEGFTPAEEVRLTRDEDHWGEPAAVGSVVLEHATGDGVRGVALASGRADLALALGAGVAAAVERPAEIVVREAASAGLVYLALSPGVAGGAALLPAVRRAIGLALDRDALEGLARPGATAVASLIPAGFPGGGRPPPRRDLDAARELLDEAGAGAGLSLGGAYPAMTVDGVDLVEVARRVRDDLADVGITLSLEAVEPAEWAERLEGGGIAVTLGQAAPRHHGSSQFARLFGLVPGGLWAERAGGSRPLVDAEQAELLAAALATDEPGAQADRYAALAEAMAGDAVVHPLLSPERFLAHRSDLVGVEPSTCCVVDLGAVGIAGGGG